ncbi:hypothetical protein MIR68_008317 [Amoeboaphelidium protococcarum]|nr:hypothetical protein MIR68_008317 [Amoeboaphelidium protococcarum]
MDQQQSQLQGDEFFTSLISRLDEVGTEIEQMVQDIPARSSSLIEKDAPSPTQSPQDEQQPAPLSPPQITYLNSPEDGDTSQSDGEHLELVQGNSVANFSAPAEPFLAPVQQVLNIPESQRPEQATKPNKLLKKHRSYQPPLKPNAAVTRPASAMFMSPPQIQTHWPEQSRLSLQQSAIIRQDIQDINKSDVVSEKPVDFIDARFRALQMINGVDVSSTPNGQTNLLHPDSKKQSKTNRKHRSYLDGPALSKVQLQSLRLTQPKYVAPRRESLPVGIDVDLKELNTSVKSQLSDDDKEKSLEIEKAALLKDSVSQKSFRSKQKLLISALIFVALLIIASSIYVGLKFLNNSGGRQGGTIETAPEIPDKNPEIPEQKIIIDKDIEKGPFGCSNYPLRAPLRSQDYSDQMESPDYPESVAPSKLKCPANSIRYTLTECDLLRMLDGSASTLDNVVRRYLPDLLTAMEIYDLNCSPQRMAMFLGQVRHETQGFTKMMQTTDQGAGSLHVLPVHFPRAITQILPLRKQYEIQREAGQVVPLTQLSEIVKASAYTEQQKSDITKVSEIIQEPQFTFLVGGWWFAQGAQQSLSNLDCVDLRSTSDRTRSTNVTSTDSTYVKVSRCIFGSNADVGGGQRLEFYQTALKVANEFQCQVEKCSP